MEQKCVQRIKHYYVVKYDCNSKLFSDTYIIEEHKTFEKTQLELEVKMHEIMKKLMKKQMSTLKASKSPIRISGPSSKHSSLGLVK